MANEKQMNSRLQMKHDVEVNWIIAGNATKPFIPKQGEIIIYDIDSTYNYERMKIGDGVTSVNYLPFIGGNSEEDGIISREQIINLLGYEPASKQDIQSYIDEAILGGAW